jgi:SagB-type dehydrogenase family enzyme
MPAKEFADLKAHQMHYKPSNLALQRKSRSWPVAGRADLPVPDLDALDRPWDAGTPQAPVTVDTLGLLLLTTAGLRGESHGTKVQRWTASGGNIGSCTAYAVIEDCPGLARGVYGYISATHELARLSSDVPGWARDAPVTLIFTGDYRKVAEKYAAFALRIVFLDAGCAQATARVTAATLGVPASFADEWDDRAIAAALGLDLDIEPVTAVITLGGSR